MKKVVHVNQHVIRKNRRDQENNPVFTVKTYKSNDYADAVLFHESCRLFYQPNNPLSCGAVAWIETTGPITLVQGQALKEMI